MNPDLTTIFSFILLLLMTILPFAYLITKKSNEHEERKLELIARVEEAKAQQTMNGRQVADDMEDRMRVLERIVTDPGTDLSRQIESLREERATRKETAS